MAEYEFPGQKKEDVADKEFPTADMIPDLKINYSLPCPGCVNITKYEDCERRICDDTPDYKTCKDKCLVEEEECRNQVGARCTAVASFYGANMPVCNDVTGDDEDRNSDNAICRYENKRYRCFPNSTQVEYCIFKKCTLNFQCGCTGEDFDAFCHIPSSTMTPVYIAIGVGVAIVLCCFIRQYSRKKKKTRIKYDPANTDPEEIELLF
jgi:hypothetical protein